MLLLLILQTSSILFFRIVPCRAAPVGQYAHLLDHIDDTWLDTGHGTQLLPLIAPNEHWSRAEENIQHVVSTSYNRHQTQANVQEKNAQMALSLVEESFPDFDIAIEDQNVNIDALINSIDQSVDSNSIINRNARPATFPQEFLARYGSSMSDRDIILDQWSLLPDEICSDPFALAEATDYMPLEKIQPLTITNVMTKYMLTHGFEEDFIKQFKHRRYIICKTRNGIKELAAKQARCSEHHRKKSNKLIGYMKERGIVLDQNVIDLEKETREIHLNCGLHGEKAWYDAIMFYLVQQNRLVDAARFRRLRSDYSRDKKKSS